MEFLHQIITSINDRSAEFIALSERLWDHPELRWAEDDAVEAQIALARSAGLSVTRDVAGLPTAFCAESGSGGPVIAILGEYDALSGLSQESGATVQKPDAGNLSGNGQGCGHHLFGPGSVLAAIAVADHLASTGMPGRIRYYGCPAEEGGAGKTFMVKAGVFDDVDAVVTWHPASTTGVLQMLSLANCQVFFHFSGIASHAALSPHLGRSALDAVELMNVGVNFLREHLPTECRVHYAITDAGGSSPNVVQAAATAFYIVRAPTVATMWEAFARVKRVAEGAALMTDTTLSVEFDAGYSELLPNAALEAVMHLALEDLGPIAFDEVDRATAAEFLDTIPASSIESARRDAKGSADLGSALHEALAPLGADPRTLMSGSTDVGDVSWVVPTVQSTVACMALGTPAHSWQMVAQGKLPAAHKGMIHAAKGMALTAARLLSDDALLAEAKAEFAERTAENPYALPMPVDTVAPPLRRRE